MNISFQMTVWLKTTELSPVLGLLVLRATIFLFLGLRISWPEKRVGRSEKNKNLQNNYIGPISVKL